MTHKSNRIGFYPRINGLGEFSFVGNVPDRLYKTVLVGPAMDIEGESYHKVAALYVVKMAIPKYVTVCHQGSWKMPEGTQTLRHVRENIDAKTKLIPTRGEETLPPVEVKCYCMTANYIKGELAIACLVPEKQLDPDVQKAFVAWAKEVRDDYLWNYKETFETKLREHGLTPQGYWAQRRKLAKKS